MKQYIYPPSAMGLADWPSGTLRLEGIEQTDNPWQADVLVCPGSLALFRNPLDLYKLPYFRGQEAKHVFLDVSDHETTYHQPSMFIRCNLRRFNIAADPNSIQMAWPVEDYAECIEPPEGGFKYDVSFQGWVTSHETRKLSTDACLANPKLKCDIATYPDFCGYLHDRKTGKWTPEGLRRRAEFRRSMKESRIALCPESINGVFPYRFWEAMSAGRVPLLVGDGFVWPFESIPYEDFSVVCPRENAMRADVYVQRILDTHDDASLIEMGKQARHYWSQFLDSRHWPRLMAMAVKQRLSAVAQ